MQKDEVNKVPPLGCSIAEQKLIESLRLYFLARELKSAALRQFSPELDEEEIERKVKEFFCYGNS